MGQKTHPIGFRLGVIKSWNNKWFAGNKFANFIYEDMMVKKYINARLDNAGLAKVVILRAPKKVTVDIHTSRPGIVIGRKGSEVDKLREELQLLTKKDISLNIIEVKRPELNARLVADSIARQLEGRVSYRRAMKKSIGASMKMGADGIKVVCSGRLAGAEIARTEKYMDGRVPLHTLRADIDYAISTAHTTYGCIGVKVWICRGMVHGAGELDVKEDAEKGTAAKPEVEMPSRRDRRRRDDKSRKRRPRGRVRRSGPRPGEGPSGRNDSHQPQGGPPPRRDDRQGGSSPRRDDHQGRRPARSTGRPSDRPDRGENKKPQAKTEGARPEKKVGDVKPKKDSSASEESKS